MKHLIIIGAMDMGVTTVIARHLAHAHEVVLVATVAEAKEKLNDPFSNNLPMALKPCHKIEDIIMPTREELDRTHVNPASRSYQGRRKRY